MSAPATIRLVANRLVAGCLPGWQQPLSIIEIAVANGTACEQKAQALHDWLHADATHLQLLIPNYGLMHTAVNAVAELLCRVLQTDLPQSGFNKHPTEVLSALAAQRPQSGVTTRLLQAAAATWVLWLHVSQNVYQFGSGHHAVLFDGALTSHTPTLVLRTTAVADAV